MSTYPFDSHAPTTGAAIERNRIMTRSEVRSPAARPAVQAGLLVVPPDTQLSSLVPFDIGK